MNGRLPEILAPVGSAQALEAALACGADAVYLGVNSLNARRSADNFTPEGLPELVRRCHITGTKVYLTLNILLLDSELPELLRIARHACEAGVDAAIVQDLGVAAVLRRCAPGLRLHASTQMSVHNPDGVRMLQALGFARVVLARECSRSEIAQIVRATPLEVEVFVHGAQCMCVSGQCYMSAVFGQRSGNRGLCAQPCRLPFTSQATDHALSLKDMSLVEQLAELQELGVASFKIEGRMKRPEYVAAAVTACRAARAGESVDMEELRSVFSRDGFTKGYYQEERTLEMFGIREKDDVTAAAGVLGRLANLYNEPRRHLHKVGIRLAFTMRANERASLTVTDCDGNRATAQGEMPQQAITKPTDAERAGAALAKTGGTPYQPESIDCLLDEGLMLPASAINALRREALEQLDQLRGRPRPIDFDEAAAAALQAPPEQTRRAQGIPPIRLVAGRVSQLSAAMLEQAQMITLPVDELARLCEQGRLPAAPARLCAGLPRILFEGRAALEKQLPILRAAGLCHAAVGNPGALELAKEYGFLPHVEPFFNLMNTQAAQELARQGAVDLTVSWELTLAAARRLDTRLPLGVTVYGYLPLMTMRVCPVRVSVGCARCKAGECFITDRKGEKLALDCRFGCPELYNPQPLYMADRLEEVAGFDFMVLRFTTEQAGECARVFEQYAGKGGKYPGAFTRGLLYRAVL